ncbi:hypothetical protein YSA_02145 [Pseudomonas putida ND6]|uniref:Uncharacterized protein n=1 Tax=Pseudomonas putida ND6 TaxID=231023 RepID=I3UR10_PSEPU|nr:hypothetical protein YSA_02145 [Pseudomonas putida ND6]
MPMRKKGKSRIHARKIPLTNAWQPRHARKAAEKL